MPAASPGRRRPRPVAGVPALDGRELARAWLVELVAAAPLEQAAALPGRGFTTQAPRLCGAVVAALGSDAAFEDLEPGGAHAEAAADAAIVAGAEGPAEAVAALESLRGVTWAALVEALHRPAPGLLADLADRLGATIATITAAALEPRTLASVPHPAEGSDPSPLLGTDAASLSAPWTVAVERRLQRHAEDGLPFALLCLELADLDRLVAADNDGDVALALEAAEAAVSAQLRPADVLIRERPGRYWLVAPESDREAASALAHLVAAAVAGVPGHRGAPLEAAAGIAVCPQDGVDAAALEGHAEEALFAARAAGMRVAGPLRG